MPGLPVLQNGLASPGVVVAGNYGHQAGSNGFGAAVGYSPTSARLQISAGLGSHQQTGIKSSVSYGLRAAAVVFGGMNGNFGIAPFAGVGGGGAKGTRESLFPVGVAAGLRRVIGSKVLSIYGAPMYEWASSNASGIKQRKGLFRASAGLDASFSSKVGATVGAEFGASAATSAPGPRGTVFGAGISYKVR